MWNHFRTGVRSPSSPPRNKISHSNMAFIIAIYIIYRYNIDMKFEWDENKRKINNRKHEIDFEEAKSVFYDDEAILIPDPDHSKEEERFLILGLSKKTNLLVVCHCYRTSKDIIRIINARKATKSEKKLYVSRRG